jgi:asparagine synthase (glutamine-hydrolysing)
MHEVAPALAGMMDEPIGDASIVPTAAVSRFARERVTVALGGDGGDELFAGYPMHTAQRVAALARATPTFARAGLEGIAGMMPVSHGNFALGFKARAFLRGAAAPPPLNHALWMSSFSQEEQRGLLTDEAFAGACEGKNAFRAFHTAWAGSAGESLIGRACHLDALTYLPNDVLTKVDRASMAVALEVRAPFLSRAVVEFAFSLPDSYRMRGLSGKRILRDAVHDLLPDEVRTRRKKGFGMPVAAWLNDSLRPLVEDLFAPDRLRAGGLFRPETVQRMLREHASRKADHRKPLWTLLVFELWRDARLRESRPALADCAEALTV